MDKVVILARVSTRAQDYQRQVTELQDYCKKAGWEVTRVFANKVSGAKSVTERAEIRSMPITIAIIARNIVYLQSR